MITYKCSGKQFKMTSNINQVAINFQYNLADIAQFSTKTIEDYSIVSRRHLEKIIHSSERCLVNKIIHFFIRLFISSGAHLMCLRLFFNNSL